MATAFKKLAQEINLREFGVIKRILKKKERTAVEDKDFGPFL